MAIKILMPALSPTMTEGNLVKWLKKEGDKIKPGEIIAEIETDKATMEVESADSGILGKIVIPAKTEGVKVNQLIAVLLENGESKSVIDKVISESITPSTPKEGVKPQATASKNDKELFIANQNHTDQRVLASPLAKRIASQEHIDLAQIRGSGPYGRVIKEDLKQAHSAIPLTGRNANEFSVVPNTQIRKVIARRLQESKQTIPHFYLTIDCNITNLLKLREQINNTAPKKGDTPSYKLSVNDFIIKAVAQALKAVPQANAAWGEDGVVLYNNVDISFAVATPDGLITPIIKNADQKSLSFISNEAKELAKRAKENALKPHEFQGGSFTISNLGMYGVKEFQAIINPPQACILAIGTSEKRPIVEGDEIKIAEIMTVSISCDHRVVDGTIAAIFINEFKKYIEQPAMMLV